MSKSFVIKNATLINEDEKFTATVFVSKAFIEKIDRTNSDTIP